MTDVIGHDIDGRPLRVWDEVVVVNSRLDYGTGVLPFPPVGSVGIVCADMDECGEFDVEFENFIHPSDIVGDSSWITHWSMIRKLHNDHRPANESFTEMMGRLTGEKV